MEKIMIIWQIFAYLFLIKHRVEAADYHRCHSTSNITSSDAYRISRDGHLVGLSEQVQDQDGYNYDNITSSPPTPVPYCFGLCDACYSCVSNSSALITQNCPVQKEVIASGNDGGCTVPCVPPNQHSQSSRTSLSVFVCNSTNVPHVHVRQFNQLLSNITCRIADRAAEDRYLSSFPSGNNEPHLYTTHEANFSDLHKTMYLVGYCVPSMSKSECSACLEVAANESFKYCNGKQGATFLTPSCVIRYELYPFIVPASAAASPSPVKASPPNASSTDVKTGNRKGRFMVVVIVLPLIFVLAIMVLILCVKGVWYRRKRIAVHKDDTIGEENIESCLRFSMDTIRAATDDFNQSNKLGAGGFGAVYQGRLPNGHLIAVKRLHRDTGQREEEFKKEVQLVARLHHKNLIRLIGFSFGVQERVLVYELAPNGSLDGILFDPIRREHLTWEIRHNIIEGIARGLVYLHKDSLLSIIHRDLKASNVLLDGSLNPKISDFGTARLYAEDHCSASRIVGTYGYMAPEYAKYGKLSAKVDVFSFGVLLLEIVSGSKNSKSLSPNRIEHLLSKAWNCWKTGKLLQLVDPILLRQGSHTDQIRRFIYIGLLCVQENALCRPSMDSVILILDGSSHSLPAPLEPAYLMDIGSDKDNLLKTEDLDSSSSHGFSSVNEMSFTNPYPEPR